MTVTYTYPYTYVCVFVLRILIHYSQNIWTKLNMVMISFYNSFDTYQFKQTYGQDK